MNIEVGFKSVIKYPFILVLPIVLQVLVSFVVGFGILFGVDLNPASVFRYGETAQTGVNYQFTLPMIIPLIEDINLSLSFLPSLEGGNWFLSLFSLLVYQVIMSFTIAMYLGSMKKVIISNSHNGDSPVQLGVHYFWRVFLFQVISYFFLICGFFVAVIFWPLVVILFLVFLIFSLAPYIIVLEDKKVGEAIFDSPTYFKRYFTKFIPLALGAGSTTFVLSLVLQALNEGVQYYVALVVYTFVGSVFIAAFMHLLHKCIEDDQSQLDSMFTYSYSRRKKVSAIIIILVLPWIGVQFANGEHVTAISFEERTTLSEGIAFKSGWSDAFNASDHTVTTYGFEQNDSLDVSMQLPVGADSVYGKGELTWKVDKEKSITKGNHTTHSIEEEFVTSNFIYRLVPVSHNGNLYYTSVNGGFAKLLKKNQSDEPMSMEIFVMNEGKDVFVFQYKSRFDPQSVIRLDREADYFIPLTSRNNPDDYKYFWYSKESMTKGRLLEFLHTKNKYLEQVGGGTDYYHYENVVAAFLQEADGEALIQFERENEQGNLTTNITSKTAEEWSEALRSLYGDVDTSTFLSYVNKANMYEGYERIGWNDHESNEYQVIIPFPEGDITINCVREDDRLVEIEIVLPE